jgi:hypothetical protein
MAPPRTEAGESLGLNDSATHLLEECRMVLPGLQALFGFQMIAVFNSGFSQQLSPVARAVHLVSIMLVVVAIALVMGPAALHRRTEPTSISQRFLQLSSRFLQWGMASLALAIALDVYIVTDVIARSTTLSVVVAALVSIWFGILWYVVPARENAARRAAD